MSAQANKTTPDRLPTRSIVANNYAPDADNKIHSDDVAAQFGFDGALVPGVAVFAYLTQPIVDSLGSAWLQRGRIAARFLKPVYHDETVSVETVVENRSPPQFAVELKNPKGILCAVAQVGLPDESPAPPDPANYPLRPLPAPADRFPNRIDAIPSGQTILGSIEFDPADHQTVGIAASFVDAVCDPLTIYRQQDPPCHPAMLVAQANQLLIENVILGPWIHTASDVQFFSTASQNQTLSLRGEVADTFTKRGHQFVELDLALFDASDQPLAHIRHTAIIRLAEPAI